MKPSYYFSRNYVEFGPFTAEEIADFAKREILIETDYVRNLKSHHWDTVAQWLPAHSAEAPAPAKAAKKPAAPKKKAAASPKAPKKAA
jgi:hypothetical protein